MALKVFGTDPADQPRPRTSFADDIVGRFRAGYTLNGLPATLEEWRVTTGDPEVADRIYELLGGDKPQEWAAKGEDNLEVFTASKEVAVIIESPKSLRQRMVMWGRQKPIYVTDGEYKLDDNGHPTAEPDPDAELSFAERKAKGQAGTGPVPDIELYFRLAEEPDLGIFRFNTGSWSLVRELAADDVEGQLAAIEGKATATLALEHVEYTAKKGPRAGQVVSFTKSAIRDIKAAE